MVSSGGELVAHRGSGAAYIPNHPQKDQVLATRPHHQSSGDQGGANAAPEPEVAGKGSCCSFLQLGAKCFMAVIRLWQFG